MINSPENRPFSRFSLFLLTAIGVGTRGGVSSCCLFIVAMGWLSLIGSPLCAQGIGVIHSLSYSAEGRTLAAGGKEGTLYLFDASTGEKRREITKAHTKGIRVVLFSPVDDALLATAGEDRVIRLWNTRTGKVTQMMQGHTRDIMSLSFSYDGSVLASGSADHTIRFWDVSTGEVLRAFEGSFDQITAMAFSPNSRVLAAVMSFNTIAFWDVLKAQLITTVKDAYVKSLAFSPDSRFLATASEDGSVRLWNMSTGKLSQTLKHSEAIEVNCVAFSPDASLLATASSDQVMRIWDPRSGKVLFEQLDEEFMYAVAFHPNGVSLSAGGDSKRITQWKFREQPPEPPKALPSKRQPPPEPPLPPQSNAASPKPSAPAQSEAQSTPKTNSTMSALENAVVAELNLARTNPSEYSKYLEALRPFYKGKRIEKPGDTPIVTQEGADALNEAIRFLKNATPVGSLLPSSGLSKAAKDHCADQGPTGRTGHQSSNGADMSSRMNRYGKWSGTAGENISYGSKTARDIVIQLIVDDGVPSRGHRQNIFEPAFKVVGVGIGPHSTYRTMCVQNFAGGYTEQ